MIERLRGHTLSDAYLGEVIPLVRERVDTLEGFFDYAAFFFQGEIEYGSAALDAMTPQGRTSAEAAKAIAALVEQQIDPLLEWSPGTVEAALKAFAESAAWPANELLMAVRAAVTGRTATPPLYETMGVLGKELVRRRLRRAAEALGARKAHGGKPAA
jgi:glutamyl-tRNA synthetase